PVEFLDLEAGAIWRPPLHLVETIESQRVDCTRFPAGEWSPALGNERRLAIQFFAICAVDYALGPGESLDRIHQFGNQRRRIRSRYCSSSSTLVRIFRLRGGPRVYEPTRHRLCHCLIVAFALDRRIQQSQLPLQLKFVLGKRDL